MTVQHSRLLAPRLPLRGSVVLPAFRARHAARPGRVVLHYTSSGNAALGRPTVVVLGGVSASADVMQRADGSPGWWSQQVGPGLAIDTQDFRVISMDFVTASRVVDAGCRSITTADQADLLAALLNMLHVPRLHALIGASYGAMVALAFATRYPERLAHLVAISGAHRAHPRAIAIRSIQRRIIELGVHAGRSSEGVALARSLAMVAYREHEEFDARFGVAPTQSAHGFRFPVEDYLDHHGRKHAARTGAEDYRELSESLDLHDVDPSGIATPATLVAADPDFLVPLSHMQELAERLRGTARLRVLRTRFGHDAFLKEDERIAAILHDALTGVAA